MGINTPTYSDYIVTIWIQQLSPYWKPSICRSCSACRPIWIIFGNVLLLLRFNLAVSCNGNRNQTIKWSCSKKRYNFTSIWSETLLWLLCTEIFISFSYVFLHKSPAPESGYGLLHVAIAELRWAWQLALRQPFSVTEWQLSGAMEWPPCLLAVGFIPTVPTQPKDLKVLSWKALIPDLAENNRSRWHKFPGKKTWKKTFQDCTHRPQLEALHSPISQRWLGPRPDCKQHRGCAKFARHQQTLANFSAAAWGLHVPPEGRVFGLKALLKCLKVCQVEASSIFCLCPMVTHDGTVTNFPFRKNQHHHLQQSTVRSVASSV